VGGPSAASSGSRVSVMRISGALLRRGLRDLERMTRYSDNGHGFLP
jgi:hypothetical protein